MNEYQNLINIVNTNFCKNTSESPIVFQEYENLDENLYNFPVNKLMNIKDNKKFLHEIYFKMLHRDIDNDSLNHLLDKLTKKKISRIKIIEKIFNSDERKMKKTKVVFNGVYNK